MSEVGVEIAVDDARELLQRVIHHARVEEDERAQMQVCFESYYAGRDYHDRGRCLAELLDAVRGVGSAHIACISQAADHARGIVDAFEYQDEDLARELNRNLEQRL